jgi:hypothetical protein
MSLSHTTGQTGRHPRKSHRLDAYPTPSVAVEALLKVEQLPDVIWEPAAGYGPIVKVLRDHGHTVITNDIKDYGFPLDSVGDFLKCKSAPPGVTCALTNPPFGIFNMFVAHALDLCPRVVMLSTVMALGSVARTEILEHRGLARVHVFRERLPMMHRDRWEGNKSTSQVYYAWFCWERGHTGPTMIDRISWERIPTTEKEVKDGESK